MRHTVWVIFEWLIYCIASDETNAAEAQTRTQIEKTSTEKLEIWICSRQSDSNISIQSGQPGYNNSISTANQNQSDILTNPYPNH